MASRNRALDERVTESGTYQVGTTVVPKTASCGWKHACFDEDAGWGKANPLDLVHSLNRKAVLEGSEGSKSFSNFPLDVCSSAALPNPKTKYPIPSSARRSDLWWEIVTATNPQTPHVSLPTFIGELKDIPDLFREWGSGLLRRLGHGNLTAQFGIKPLVADLRALFAFQAAVEQRLNWLRRLMEGRVIKRRCHLGQSKAVEQKSDYILQSGYCYTIGTQETNHSQKEWGAAQWAPLPFFYDIPKSIEEALKKARAMTFGLSTAEGIRTVWNLIPWSWLVDWFFQLDRLLGLAGNLFGLRPQNVCYMQTVESSVHYTGVSPIYSWVSVLGLPGGRVVWKYRTPLSGPTSSISPTMLPLVDPRQLSILGSLAVVRNRGLR